MPDLEGRLTRYLEDAGPDAAATQRARVTVLAQATAPMTRPGVAARRRRAWRLAITVAMGALAAVAVTAIVQRDSAPRPTPAIGPLAVLNRTQTASEAQAAAAGWVMTTRLERSSLRRLTHDSFGVWFVGQTDDARICVVHVAPAPADSQTLAVDGSACATPQEVRARHGIGLISETTLALAVTGDVQAARRSGGASVRPLDGVVVLGGMTAGVDVPEVLVDGRWRTLPMRPGSSAFRFSSLDRPVERADGLPETARGPALASGVDLATLRRSDVDGRPYWLGWGDPAGLALCLITTPASVQCSGTGLIDIAGAAVFAPGGEGTPDPSAHLTAIVPDGYTRAQAAGVEGVMTGNIVVFLETLPLDAELVLTGPAGTRHVAMAAAP